MRGEARDAALLWDMLQTARLILEFTKGVDEEGFLADRKLQFAVERAVGIVGEAASKVSPGFQRLNPGIPWRAIVGQRNILIHNYGRVDPLLVWNLTKVHIPELVARMEPLVPPAPEEE